MTRPVPNPVHLAEDISTHLHALSEYVDQGAPPEAVARVLGSVLDGHDGILGRLTAFVENGSRATRKLAEEGSLRPDTWLALGRAANDLVQLCVELEDHTADFKRLGTPQAAATSVPPIASALVARRHR